MPERPAERGPSGTGHDTACPKCGTPGAAYVTLCGLDTATLRQFADIVGAFHADLRDELLRRAESRAAGEGDT